MHYGLRIYEYKRCWCSQIELSEAISFWKILKDRELIESFGISGCHYQDPRLANKWA